MTICSTGIGGASVAVALEELADLGANTFIRVDYVEPIRQAAYHQELIIPTGAMRYDGISDDYILPEYPAFAQHEIVQASILAAKRLGMSYRMEIIGSLASLANDQDAGNHKFRSTQISPVKEIMSRSGVNAIDGESASVFVICGIYGFRSGALHMFPRINGFGRKDDRVENQLISVGLETIHILAEWDQKNESKGTSYVYPDLGVLATD